MENIHDVTATPPEIDQSADEFDRTSLMVTELEETLLRGSDQEKFGAAKKLNAIVIQSEQRIEGWGRLKLGLLDALGTYLLPLPKARGRPPKLSNRDSNYPRSYPEMGVDHRIAHMAMKVAKIPKKVKEAYLAEVATYGRGKHQRAREPNYSGLMAFVENAKTEAIEDRTARDKETPAKHPPAVGTRADVPLTPDEQRAEMALVRLEIDQMMDLISDDASEEQRAELADDADSLWEMAGAARTRAEMDDLLGEVRDLKAEYEGLGVIVIPDEVDEGEVIEDEDEVEVTAPKPAPQYTCVAEGGCREFQLQTIPPPPGCAQVIELMKTVMTTPNDWVYLGVVLRQSGMLREDPSVFLEDIVRFDAWWDGLTHVPFTDKLMDRLRARIDDFQRAR